MLIRRSASAICFTLAAAFSMVIVSPAQSALSSPTLAPPPVTQANRIAASPNLAPHVQLSRHVPGWAVSENQAAKPVDLSTQIHVSLLLSRDAAAEAAFDQLLADQQNPASPRYHQWLTSEQIGTLYGPTQDDLNKLVSWATAQGLTLVSVQPNHVMVEFSGSLATVASAFHTSFAYFNVSTGTRLSATNEPSIPAAFSAVIKGVHGLSEVHHNPQYRMSVRNRPSQGEQPQYTQDATDYYMLPGDFDTIYDLNPVYTGGDTGATIGAKAQHIAIIGRSRVVSSDITTFENISNLASYLPNVVLAGTDPGSSNKDDAGEATLDVDRVISTAPGATVDLVISANKTQNGVEIEDGVDIAMQYNVNTLKDPIMTISFGSCEVDNGAAEVQSLDSLFQTAAGEGITTFVSSDDSGAAGCETAFAAPAGTQVLSINAICASGYVTCVGGTEFNDASNYSLYWSSKNSTTNNSSALSYIPEGAWNEPVTTSKGVTTDVVGATGGGKSIYISKPSWQTGTGVPLDNARDVPDVAFSAADHDGYVGCFALGGGNCTTSSIIFSGTSAAAPGMAGVAALLNTKAGVAEGNINPLLYSTAASSPTAFHDATIATSGVSGCTTATPSMCNNSTPSASSLTGGLAGYALTAGYDQATGLGSLDVAKFITAAASTTTVSTTLALTTVSPNPATTSQSVTITATLTPGTSSKTPTGTVQFYETPAGGTATAIGSAVTIASNVATLNYTFITAGTYGITAIYTSGDANFSGSSATAVSLVVNTPVYTVTPTTTSYTLISGATAGNTDIITVSSTSSFTGSVALACAVTNVSGTAAGSCSLGTSPLAITAGGSLTSLLTITTTPGTSGVLSVKVTGTSGSNVIGSGAITANLTASTVTLSSSPAKLSFASGATTANTSAITLATTTGFAGTVQLSCALTSNAPGYYAPTCAVSPASLSFPTNSTATLTITSTLATTSQLDRRWPFGGSGVVLAALFFIPAIRRRRSLRSLATLAILFCGIASLTGCGGSSSPVAPTPKSSAGTYTATITGTGTATGSSTQVTATTTVTVTIH